LVRLILGTTYNVPISHESQHFIEVCIPVNTEYKKDVFYSRIIKGGLYMSTIHIGSHEEIHHDGSAERYKVRLDVS